MEQAFSIRNYLAQKTPEKKIQGIASEVPGQAIYLTEGYKKFAEQMPAIEQNNIYEFVSFGQWSLKQVVFHVLKLIGPAHICSTTYGLGPDSARSIVDALNKKSILSFQFLYDHKIKQYKEEAHYLCASNFPVKITTIHAKITVLLNENWGVTISGSANWSDSNNKIELTTISTNRASAEFHKNWISQAIESKMVEPLEILKTITL